MTAWKDTDDTELRSCYDGCVVLVRATEGQPEQALAHGLPTLQTVIDTQGPAVQAVRDCWPQVLQAALTLARHQDAHRIVSMLADRPPGHVPPYLRAHLARGRALLNAAEGRHDTVQHDLQTAIDASRSSPRCAPHPPSPAPKRSRRPRLPPPDFTGRPGMIYVMSGGDPGRDAFEQLRAIAREVGKSVDRLSGELDFDQIANRIAIGGERLKELAEFAGQRLTDQFQDPDARSSAPAGEPRAGTGQRRLLRVGPHPLDTPTEEQGLVLSALESGRWSVQPGTNELISAGDGPSPSERDGVVSELRARDWIAASGAVTIGGRAALERWGQSSPPG